MKAFLRSYRFLGCFLALGLVACGVEPGAGSSSGDDASSLPAGESVSTDTETETQPETGPDDSGADEQTEPVDEEQSSGEDGPGLSEPDEEEHPDLSACDEASALFSMCASPVETACDAPEVAECILGTPSAVDGYCALEAGASACDAGGPSRELYEWCAIEACLGGSYQECIALHAAECVPQVCEDLQAVVGYCDGYGYDCPSRSPEEAACLLEVFEALESPCGLFIESPLLCAGPIVSEWGWGSCHVQRCTGVSTFEDCYANLEILCAATGF